MATSSPLLSLPPELRNRIWEYTVFSETTIVIGVPPITRLTRELRAEVLPIYLTLNTFRLPGGYGRAWLTRLPAKRRAQIRRLHIDLGASRRYVDDLLQSGLTPARTYLESDAQLGWRIVWVGADHMPEYKRRHPVGSLAMVKEDIVAFADREGYCG
ncbi:hypothetical protein LTR36_005839 [Oleoguttula mirabilis]|uniref:Uncharacterized protein n=1 Tax=Oleoguttula mirabilis TaxID=1507867 RepID=A0AAV9JD72_9PEZI|nr:hypothetical protein LTR36_005839 [Oleoguttula mirabilis]